MNLLFHHLAALSVRNRWKHIAWYRDNALQAQQEVYRQLTTRAAHTVWGREYGYAELAANYQAWNSRVPVSPYETFFPYVERALKGEPDVLWPGRAGWFAKSSGTTNDKSKFIPITPESLHGCHYAAGKDMAAMYLHHHPDSRVFGGYALGLGGSHEVSRWGSHARYGDLSAVLIQNMPRLYDMRRTPSRDIALMGEWEAKIEKMARQVMRQDVTSLLGVPTWAVVLFHRIFELMPEAGRNLWQVWPHFEVFFHGGVAFTPYRQQFAGFFPGKPIRYYEIYNASEGYFAFQDEPGRTDMLLLPAHGIFYEFIPMSEFGQANASIVPLEGVVPGVNYAIVISTNGGLWRYLIGDTVRFTSTRPWRLQITGRTRHFINAFGEELVVENADQALAHACAATGASITDYTAAPIYFEGTNAGGHEWLIEFGAAPADLHHFATLMDDELKRLNSDYEAKRHKGMALGFPVVHALAPGSFQAWLKQRGRLGGQNKVPRLSNDRTYADGLLGMNN